MPAFKPDVFKNPQTAEILAELGAVPSPDGISLAAVYDETVTGICIEKCADTATVRYGRPVYLYRALGLICERGEPEFKINETARFGSNGVMIDCSRNAVPRVETVKNLIRRMALMGMNTLMLYTEDTYEIPGDPYFGYMRGRYSRSELQRLDAYASGFGVEMIPCIQTLAHLRAALKWAPYRDITDFGDILLADEPETYAFIERMLASCRASFKSRRIHVGMDEAHMLGRGKYYDRHGDSDRFELMSRHLKMVAELCKKYGFEPIMWSDMFFRLANGGDYSGQNPVPAEAAASIPRDVSLVYWDYYNDDIAEYDRMMKAHKALPGSVIFAGGAWKWQGFLPSLKVSVSRAATALAACALNGVRDVFTTAWGDDGAEAGLFSLLPVFQAQAELGFYDNVSEAHLARRLKACAGAALADFMLLDMPELDPRQNNGLNNPHKYLLYQDVLMGLFDLHIPEGTAARYEELYKKLHIPAQKSDPCRYLFKTAEALFGVLALKSELGVQLRSAYDGGDRAFIKKAAEEILPELIVRAEAFRDCLEAQWMEENKPFGFEVQDIRLGGLIQRLKTTVKRLEAYLSGDAGSLPELEEARLPFYPGKSGDFMGYNSWLGSVTASVM